MMHIDFIPLDYDYFDWQGKNYVRVVGRDSKGKRVCVVDTFDAYFWAILKEKIGEKKIQEIIEKIKKIKVEQASRVSCVEKVEIHEKNFLGKPVKALKVFITNYKDAHAIADKLEMPEIEAKREYDINLITKYIIDKKLLPLQWHKISGNITEFAGLNNLDVDYCIFAEKIEKIQEQKNFFPKILAFDIEAEEFEVGKGEILMISLASENFKKVLTWKKVAKAPEFVEFCKDEADMLEKFVEYVKKQDPDLLVGYFSDGFDLPYLRARAEKNKVKLALGLDGSPPIFARGRIISAQIFGIVHVDLFKFIETVYAQYLQSETLSLDEVASELLGEGKKDFNHKHSSEMREEEWCEYFEYNLQDSLLTLKLAEKLWPDMKEFCNIVQEPLFEITRDSMSQLLEHYILHHLQKYNEIAEKRPTHDEISERKKRKPVEGAFVLQPKAGLYENLAIFDFTSMHTSIIVSFNISKTTLTNSRKDAYETPEIDWQGKKVKFYFTKKRGFLPDMFEELIKKRKQYKQEYKANPSPITKARSNAFKVLTAAVHGYIGFFGARYYSLESSASILAFVRKFNKETIEKVKKAGYEVIYSDTDSIAFCLGKKTKKDVLELLKKLNSELPGIMELELEDFYARGIWVTKRTGEFGAKKKYA
ncbi:MAG: DNA-directed DNA polymerase, partial [Candidatus Pacearchaeota archaeon]